MFLSLIFDNVQVVSAILALVVIDYEDYNVVVIVVYNGCTFVVAVVYDNTVRVFVCDYGFSL